MPASPPQRRERYGYVWVLITLRSTPTTHTPTSKSERAPSAPLQSHTRYTKKNKKDCKGSPWAFPCQGLSALRVHSIKISTIEAYGSIFIGSALTSSCPRAKKQSFFIFLSFFLFFLSLSFFRNY